MTLPQGPIERGKDWYAQAREAVNICGFYSLGAGFERPCATYILTNIVEKPWQLSAAMCTLFCQQCLGDCADRSRISWWSDCGPHFRAYLLLCYMATTLMSMCKLDFSYSFGPEQHFKNEVDGMFGWLRGALARITKKHIVGSIADLVTRLQEEP